jgi:chromosome segregation ATPase
VRALTAQLKQARDEVQSLTVDRREKLGHVQVGLETQVATYQAQVEQLTAALRKKRSGELDSGREGLGGLEALLAERDRKIQQLSAEIERGHQERKEIVASCENAMRDMEARQSSLGQASDLSQKRLHRLQHEKRALVAEVKLLKEANGRCEALLAVATARRGDCARADGSDELSGKIAAERRRILQVVGEELGTETPDEAGLRALLGRLRLELKKLRQSDEDVRQLVAAKSWQPTLDAVATKLPVD